MTRRRRLAVMLSTAAILAITPSAAHAQGRGGDGARGNGAPSGKATPSGSAGKGWVGAGVRFDLTKNGKGTRTGPVTPVSDWRPPPCWYAPKWDPEGAARDFLGYDRSPNHTGMEDARWIRGRYVDGHPYTDFNLAKQGKGYWWTAFYNDSRLTDLGVDACTKPPFWVDRGDPPKVKNAVTPQVLAQLAYARIRIPHSTALTSPAGTLTVNLPTWVWLDHTAIHPVSVRAYLPELDIQATTTATPVGLHIDPGTPDATLFPASGDCPAGPDGSLGTPYPGHDSGDPPCGVTYLRSTHSGAPYQLTATVTWKITWTGTGHPTPVALPEGTYGTPQDATVREIQTINR